MSRFHALTVTDVSPETRDAVVVTLKPQPGEEHLFRFTQGQYLTFRKNFGGEEVRRCYSICSGIDDGCLKVGIKQVSGGAFSTWANENLKPGDVVEAMRPLGSFFAPLQERAEKFYLGFAGGSGITPILSIIKTVLAREPNSRFTLVYANRQVASIMFREELEDLKNKYLGRFQIVHILKNDTQEADLFTGRIDADKVDRLLQTIVDPSTVDQAFLCGPQGMMETVKERLQVHGVSDERIKWELFTSDQPGRLPLKTAASSERIAETVTVLDLTMDGTTRQIHMAPGETVLQAAHRHDIDAPYSCCAGVCSTCRGRVLDGDVEMAANHALEDDEIRDGFVLTCQSRPLSKTLRVTYDA